MSGEFKYKKPRMTRGICIQDSYQEKLTTLTAPADLEAIQHDGRVIDLQDDQEKDKEQSHEDRHEGCSAPTGSDLPIFRIERFQNISQSSPLCHD